MSIEILPKNSKDRIIACKYIYNNEIRIWNGKKLNCEHNKEKRKCTECKGAGICEHNRRKNECTQCGGSSICEHNKKRNICKDCKGSSICEHNKRRSYCRQCKGTSICEHNKIRTRCKECDGTSICEHNRQRSFCKDCKGSGICEHNRRQRNCRDCFTHPQNFCQLCTFIYVENSAYYPHCFNCYCYLHSDENIPRRYRIKENYINDFLKEYYPTVINNKTITSACSSGKRPDWYIELLTHTIIIECDEDQHSNYSCENKRMMQLFTDLGNRPIVFIRFNPDKYTKNTSSSEGQITQKECFYYDEKNKLKVNESEWQERSTVLLQTIKENENIPDKEITIIKLYYKDTL